jgi:hypothetical protein
MSSTGSKLGVLSMVSTAFDARITAIMLICLCCRLDESDLGLCSYENLQILAGDVLYKHVLVEPFFQVN